MSSMDNDRNAPATKGDMQDLEARLEARLQDLEARQNERHEMLRAEMGHSFDDLKQTFRDKSDRASQGILQLRAEYRPEAEGRRGKRRKPSPAALCCGTAADRA